MGSNGRLAAVSSLILVLGVAGCGGGDSTPRITELTVSPSELGPGGGTVKVRWVTRNAEEVTLWPGVGTVKAEGELALQVRETTVFVLTASRRDGRSARSTAEVTVPTELPQVELFAASPAALPFGGGEVTLQWRVRNATKVVLDPGGETVAFEGTKTARLDASAVFSLRATNALGTREASLSVPVSGKLLVQGQVVASAWPLPVKGAKVRIGDTVVETDADGRFLAPNVTPPYDAEVALPEAGRSTVYRGLNRFDPVLMLDGHEPTRVTAGMTSGEVTQGEPAVAAEEGALVRYVSNQGGSGFGYTQEDGTFEFPVPDAYAAAISWYGAPTDQGSLVAVDQVGGTSPMFGRVDGVTVSSGADLHGQRIAMMPMPSIRVSGTVNAPEGYDLFQKQGGVVIPPSGQSYSPDNDRQPPFDFNLPLFPGTQTYLQFEARKFPLGARSVIRLMGYATSVTDTTINLPPAAELQSPATDAAFDATTEFRWSPTQGAVYLLRVMPASGQQGPRWTVVTAEPKATLSSLDALGISWPVGTGYTWEVLSVLPVLGGVDEAATLSLSAKLGGREPAARTESGKRSLGAAR